MESASNTLRSLDNLNFDNTALRYLPIDKDERNTVRRSIANACFSKVAPTPVENPRLVAASIDALMLLDLNPDEINKKEFAEYFGGNKILPGSQPAAHCYCGHQFGNFAGQLGDGRAMYLGEMVNSKGERWELQLKGAGQTPYSRDADGRAVLRSSIREFLCSELMYYAGVPTTRAGSIVTSDTYAVRDLKYDGHPIRERVTICSRIAPTFIRFGSFQICNGPDETTGRPGPSMGKYNVLYKLLEYVIEIHYPHIWAKNIEKEDKYAEFFAEVVDKTAKVVAEWQCIGWAHGVLNTDNISIMGLTIDYGPFGFLDYYDPDFICNGSDDGGRYSFKNQPSICKWNLEKLAEALEPLIPKERTDPIIAKYDDIFQGYFSAKMHKKLGLFKELPEDKALIDDLLRTMQETGCDYTNGMRSLSKIPSSVEDSSIDYLVSQCCSVKTLKSKFTPRIPPQQMQMLLMMLTSNPSYLQMMGVSGDFIMDEIKRADKYAKLKELLQEDKTKNDREMWSKWVERYRNRLQSETDITSEQRVQTMNLNNPKFILRNYIAQNAIEKAEKGDFTEVERLLKIFKNPFDEWDEYAAFNYTALPPDWASSLCVTCSS